MLGCEVFELKLKEPEQHGNGAGKNSNASNSCRQKCLTF